MCCIFTCCGWIIDLVQRFWTFTMSCCISSAVCCALITASMSGVALGYNYSLAEYIELKETNVSVYLKRGVFDDEVADEMDWRRSGGGPPVKKPGPTMPAQEYAPEPERRRNGPFETRSTEPVPTQSIFESDDHHKFEGSLFKLTGKPVGMPSLILPSMTRGPGAAWQTGVPPSYPILPYPKQESWNQQLPLQQESHQANDVDDLINRRKMDFTVRASTSTEQTTLEIERDPLEQMRIIQQLINQKKNAAKKLTTPHTNLVTVTYYRYPKIAPYATFTPLPPSEADDIILKKIGHHPDPNYDPSKWYNPRPATPVISPLQTLPLIETPRPRASIPPAMAPTRKLVDIVPTVQTESTTTKLLMNLRKSYGDQTDLSDNDKENDLLNTLNEPEVKEYEDDDIKGLPVRKRRSILNPKNDGINTDTKSNRKDDNNNINTNFKTKKNNTSENNDETASLIKKIITVIKRFNDFFALSEIPKTEDSKVSKVGTTILATSPIPSIDTASLSSISTSTDKLIVLIKSTIIS